MIRRSLLAVALAASLVLPMGAGADARYPREHLTPAGKIVILAVNARQNSHTVDPTRLEALAQAIRSRPLASDGRFYAPDVIIFNETTRRQIGRLTRKLQGLFEMARYEMVGSGDQSLKAKFVVNVATTDIKNRADITWPDSCLPDRLYQASEGLIERASGAVFSVAGVHFSKDYPEDRFCKELNIQRMRLVTAIADGATIVGGDMNRRAMNEQLQCDPFERSGDLPWYAEMVSTTSIDTRSFVDMVRYWNRANDRSLADEWSHEWQEPSELCDGTRGYRHNRIDYLFASVPGVGRPVLGATTDAAKAGEYSDHRIVWGMLRIAPRG